MTRHFFAFLALLSGLAALSGPAHASALDPLACAASLTECDVSDRASEQVAANAPPSTVSQSIATQARAPLAAQPLALRAPVLMGIDRAYE
jgi:hypothetical protein